MPAVPSVLPVRAPARRALAVLAAAVPLALAAPATAATPPSTAVYVQWLQDEPGAGPVQVGLLRARATVGDRAQASGYVDAFDCPDGGVPSVDGGPCTYLGTRVLQGDDLRLTTGDGLRTAALTGVVTAYAGDAYGGDVGPVLGTERVALRLTATGPPEVAVGACTEEPQRACRTTTRPAAARAADGLFSGGLLSGSSLSVEQRLGAPRT